jgi:aminoglycoside/choline kinase family phosphotransferase
MSQPSVFKETPGERLQNFLIARFGEIPGRIVPLTPDASTREYFRIDWQKSTAIACVYGEKFEPETQPYLDVTNLFAASGLPVAKVYEVSSEFGIIVHEDFGNKILRPVLEIASEEERETLINQAISLIAGIQAATPKAFELDSIASRLAFDEEKLGWEINFFTKHFFESLREEHLSETDAASLKNELGEVTTELAARPRVLCHRDFHAANLMIDRAGELKIIDHQDARMGAASYDLVSLLLDRVLEPPSPAWIREKRFLLLEKRRKLGLNSIDPDEFALEFRLMTIQRCLKAIGTFSFQTAVRHKENYVQYIEPMLLIVLQAAQRLERFPNLQRIITERLK